MKVGRSRGARLKGECPPSGSQCRSTALNDKRSSVAEFRFCASNLRHQGECFSQHSSMTRFSLLLALAAPLNAALLGQIAVTRGSRTSQISAVQRTKTEISVRSAASDLRKLLRGEQSEQAETAAPPSSTSALAATFAAAAAAANSAAAPFSEAAEPSDSSAVAVAAAAIATVTPAQLVESFVAATERGDAAAALKLITDDFLYKTHSATTESLAAAEERLHTKCPAPAKVGDGAPNPYLQPRPSAQS